MVLAGQHLEQTIPEVRLNNETTISCAGYAGLRPASIGVVFALATGRTGNRYWMSELSVLSEFSDWPRGSLSLFVNGAMRNSTTFDGDARGTAQHGGRHAFESGVEHTATIRYTPAMRMP